MVVGRPTGYTDADIQTLRILNSTNQPIRAHPQQTPLIDTNGTSPISVSFILPTTLSE
jgi:hypothetical protein